MKNQNEPSAGKAAMSGHGKCENRCWGAVVLRCFIMRMLQGGAEGGRVRLPQGLGGGDPVPVQEETVRVLVFVLSSCSSGSLFTRLLACVAGWCRAMDKSGWGWWVASLAFPGALLTGTYGSYTLCMSSCPSQKSPVLPLGWHQWLLVSVITHVRQ